MTRTCPVDAVPLTPKQRGRLGPDVTVDECPRCHGVFLDQDELGRLTADHALNKRLRFPRPHANASTRACPSCGARMARDAARDVEVDVCPRCHGLWLDEDELEALAMR